MNGVKLEVEIDGQPEDVYFATRRDGEANEAMRKAKWEYYGAIAKVAALTQRTAMAGKKAEALRKNDKQFAEKLEAIAADQEKALCELAEWKDRMQSLAEDFVRNSLEENYGAEAKRIMKALTDSQVDELVSIVCSGDTASDFFPSRATRRSASSGEKPQGPSDASC